MGGMLLTMALVGLAPTQDSPAKSELRTVSYLELGQAVREKLGKVVLVYFWADY